MRFLVDAVMQLLNRVVRQTSTDIPWFSQIVLARLVTFCRELMHLVLSWLNFVLKSINRQNRYDQDKTYVLSCFTYYREDYTGCSTSNVGQFKALLSNRSCIIQHFKDINPRCKKFKTNLQILILESRIDHASICWFFRQIC